MPAFSKTGVPFLLQGSGTIAVDASRINLRAPLAPDAPLLSVDFTADGAQPLVLGQPGTVKLGLAATARAVVVPMFPGSAGAPMKLLEANGLGGYFAAGAHADRVVLAFDVGASADANVTGTFTYAPLTAATTVDTGGDGGFSYLASFDAARPAGEILPEFFKSMRLPEQLDRAPHPGEAVCLRYGRSTEARRRGRGRLRVVGHEVNRARPARAVGTLRPQRPRQARARRGCRGPLLDPGHGRRGPAGLGPRAGAAPSCP